MTFLNPFILIAMAAAGIPLLLHLLNLRKLRTVEFSSLRFLKELQKTRIRKLKLKQILLLILRTSLVIFSVLAFARPALQGSAGLPGSHAATTAVILIDDSFSMGVRDERGERFEQARQAALDVVELLEENDEAYLVSMTDLKRAIDAEPSRNREAMRRTISEMKMSYRRADLDDALRVASTLLYNSENINKELYIITDAQRGNVQAATDSLTLFTEATRVYIMPVGLGSDQRQSNLALDSIRILSSVFERDKPVEIRGWVHNYGDAAVENATVSMYVGTSRLAQATVSVEPGKSEIVEISAPPKGAGLVSGHLEISGDGFEADNRRYFAFRVLDRMRVALVGAAQSVQFLDVVLGLSAGTLETEKFSAVSLPAVDLSRFSTVVLSDVPSISSTDAARLSEYVNGGGGVVIYGGPSVDPNNFNSTLGVELGIGLGSPAATTGAGGAGVGFASVEKEHPIFNGVFDPSDPGSVESPTVSRILPATGGESVIRLTNGMPFMSEFRRGRGRVVYVAAPPTREWGDLPVKGIFVPIAIRSALYVGATGESFVQSTVGESVTIPLPGRGNLPEQVKVTPPGGEEKFVPVRKLPSGSSIGYDNTGTPGVYRVNAGGEDISLFTANMGSGESDLTPMTEEQLRDVVATRMINPQNLTVLESSAGDFEEPITASRFGLELWRYMLGLALLCAFLEMIVGRALSPGPSPSRP